MQSNDETYQLSRRHMLRLLAALGITGPAAVQLSAQQARRPISPEALKAASAIIEHDLAEDRLEVAAEALERDLDQFRPVRELEIDDLVEPSTIFVPREV
jgi:hypothetical protein